MLDINLAGWHQHEMWDFHHKFQMTGVENTICFHSCPNQYLNLIKTDVLQPFSSASIAWLHGKTIHTEGRLHKLQHHLLDSKMIVRCVSLRL